MEREEIVADARGDWLRCRKTLVEEAAAGKKATRWVPQKGCGEAGTVGALPAAMSAICDALGVVHIDMPATPERVWRALKDKAAA